MISSINFGRIREKGLIGPHFRRQKYPRSYWASPIVMCLCATRVDPQTGSLWAHLPQNSNHLNSRLNQLKKHIWYWYPKTLLLFYSDKKKGVSNFQFKKKKKKRKKKRVTPNLFNTLCVPRHNDFLIFK